jgi:hypothetical protein
MPEQELKTLLAKLHQELENTDQVEAETLDLVRKLDADIHKLVGTSSKTEAFESVLEHARLLKSRFAANHPVAERFVAEITDTLARLGI